MMKTEPKFVTIWRTYLEKSFNILIPILAILAAFLVSGILIYLWGSSPIAAYGALFSGAFGSPNAWATTLTRLTPLMFTGMAVMYGYRGGFFNIGVEGQLYMGAIATVWLAVTFPHWPAWALAPACVLISAAAGCLWVLLPAYLKAFRGINEVLTTLLMNYIILQYFEWVIRVDHIIKGEGVLIHGDVVPVWTFLNYIGIKDPMYPFPKSPYIVDASHLPSLETVLTGELVSNWLGGQQWYQSLLAIPSFDRMTLAPVIGVLVAILMIFLMFKTTTGYRSRAVGINPQAARFMGINVRRTLFTTALISGTLGGLAGGMEVLGNQHRVIPGFLVNAGFDGIPVALIGQLHPVGVLLSSSFFGALRAGANKMQIVTSVPVAVVYIISALAIVFAVAGTTVDLQSTLKKRRIAREAGAQVQTEALEGEVPNV